MQIKQAKSAAGVVAALLVVASLWPVVSPGQQSQDVPPDSYFIQRAGGALTALPVTGGNIKGKAKLGGLGGVKTTVTVPGEAANIRLKTGEPQAFVMGIRTPLPDPLPNAAYAWLHKLEVKRGKRELLVGDVSSYVVTARSRTFDPRGIPLNFARYGAQALRIEPRSPLPPGEYAFIMQDQATPESDPYRTYNDFRVFCFGVE
jgi:hypothetical protein